MRRNVLTAGLVACGLTATGPGAIFAAVPARATHQPAERSALVQATGASTGAWEQMGDRLTIPLGPTFVDPWPFGPCRAVGAGDAL